MSALREAEKLQRMTHVEAAYTLFMVVGIIACAGLAESGKWWSVLIAVALFVPKFMLAARWERQKERVADTSPEARATVDRLDREFGRR